MFEELLVVDNAECFVEDAVAAFEHYEMVKVMEEAVAADHIWNAPTEADYLQQVYQSMAAPAPVHTRRGFPSCRFDSMADYRHWYLM